MATVDTTSETTQPAPATPESERERRAFRPDIEGLRAIAVTAVVFYHSGLAVRGGYIGVDVFFVISGFLITRHLYGERSRTGRISLLRFYARRVRRILPAATVVIVATLIGAFLWVPSLEIHSVGIDAVFAALFSINFRIADSGVSYFANPAPSPFQQYWSLAIEEQFYALWPLLLLGVTAVDLRRLSRRGAVSAFLVVVIAVSLVFSVTLTESSSGWAYFGLQTRAWELALGALVAVNAESISRAIRSVAGAVTWVGLAAIVVPAFLYTAATAYPGYAVVLPVAGAALVIAGGGGGGGGRGAERILGLRPFQYVGRISYSWYLWHWPVFILLPFALGHAASRKDFALALVGSLVLAAASYAWVEQPVRKNQRLVSEPRRGLLLGAGLIAASVLCAVLVMVLDVVPGDSGAPLARAQEASLLAGTRPAGGAASALAAVQRAVGVRTLPSDLSPPLVDAPEDHANYACLDLTTASAPLRQDTCVLGDVHSTRTVVLFGDSHAWQWTQSLAAVASARHWKLVTYTKASCPAEDNTVMNAYQDYIHCGQWRAAVFRRLAVLRPQVVIMSSVTQADSTPTSMSATIARLEADGSRVVWLEDTPSPVVDVPVCLSQYPADVQRCSYTTAAGLFALQLRDSLNRAAARDGAVVVDPVPWFCTTTVCPPIIDDAVAYFDGNHISNTYALTLAPALSAALETVMPR
jgi:peptidoglycan/LPS O-acetylase OafA/YrhL